MELHTAEALVLDVTDLQEQDRIITFLTRERGKKKGVARSARRRFSRFAGQLQLLATVQITWFEKAGRDLVRITQVELVRPVEKLYRDLDSLLLLGYLADHMIEFAQEDEPADLYYRLLDSTLKALVEGADLDLAARYFEAWVLRLAGVFPAPEECPSCGGPYGDRALLPASGDGLLCARCAGQGFESLAGKLVVKQDVLDFLRRISRERLGDMTRQPPPADLLRRLEELHARVRRAFLQRELRSYRVLQQTRRQLEPAG